MYRDLVILGAILKIRALEDQLRSALNTGRAPAVELQADLDELKSRVDLLGITLDQPVTALAEMLG